MNYAKIFSMFESVYGNLATVYHRTNLKNVIYNFDKGDKFIPGGGDFYGKGMYSTFDLQTALRYNNGTANYGKYIIKFNVTNVNNYLIFDWALFSQFEKFKELQRKYQDISNKNFIKYQLLNYGIWPKTDLDNLPILNRTKSIEEIYGGTRIETQASIAKTLVETLSIDKCVPGIIYTDGHHDPNVLVTYERDLKYLIPLSYSTDDGLTWTKFMAAPVRNFQDASSKLIKSKYFISQLYNYFSKLDRLLYTVKEENLKDSEDPLLKICLFIGKDNDYLSSLKEKFTDNPALLELKNIISHTPKDPNLDRLYISIFCIGRKVNMTISFGTDKNIVTNFYSRDLFIQNTSLSEETRVEEYILKYLRYLSLEENLEPYCDFFLNALDNIYFDTDLNRSSRYYKTYNSYEIYSESDFEEGDESIDKVNSEFLNTIEDDIKDLKAKYKVIFSTGDSDKMTVYLLIDSKNCFDFTSRVKIKKDTEIINQEIKKYYYSGKKFNQNAVREILSKCKIIGKFLKLE